ncbi:hypothetical protein D3C73_1327080 [compost metagenome]
MKKIWTDFNGPNPNRLRISNLDMEYFKLSDGELVIMYTEPSLKKLKRQEKMDLRMESYLEHWLKEIN